MTPLARLPLATKLPAMMVLLALAGMIAFGALSFLSVREMSRKDSLSDLAAQADAVARGLQARIGDLRDRASALGTDPATLEALLTLGGASAETPRRRFRTPMLSARETGPRIALVPIRVKAAPAERRATPCCIPDCAAWRWAMTYPTSFSSPRRER